MGERTIKVSSGTLIATSPSGAGMDVRFPSRVLTGDCEPRKSAFISLSFRRRRSTDTSPPLNHRPLSLAFNLAFSLALSLLSLVSLSLLNPRPDPPTIEKTTIEHTTKDARRPTQRRAFRGVSRKFGLFINWLCCVYILYTICRYEFMFSTLKTNNE